MLKLYRLTAPSAPHASTHLCLTPALHTSQDVLKGVPGARLALVGDGPERAALEAHFAGTATTFVGMLHGAELAAAYASADVFVMPSESETLGE